MFQSLRDTYLHHLIRSIATEDRKEETVKSMDVYLGNVHVSPIARQWNTFEYSSEKELKKLGDFGSVHKMSKNYNELAEEKIEKQAMMEALFGTQYWMESYVKNPYLYVTDHDSDFEGEKGIVLKDQFKKMFYINYKKYQDIIKQVEETAKKQVKEVKPITRVKTVMKKVAKAKKDK